MGLLDAIFVASLWTKNGSSLLQSTLLLDNPPNSGGAKETPACNQCYYTARVGSLGPLISCKECFLWCPDPNPICPAIGSAHTESDAFPSDNHNAQASVQPCACNSTRKSCPPMGLLLGNGCNRMHTPTHVAQTQSVEFLFWDQKTWHDSQRC